MSMNFNNISGLVTLNFPTNVSDNLATEAIREDLQPILTAILVSNVNYPNSTHYTSLSLPGSITLTTSDETTGGVTFGISSGQTGHYTLTMPPNAGTLSNVLSTNGSGALSWVAPATGSLGFVVNSGISYQRDLVTFYDTDGPKTIRKWLSYTDPVTSEPIFALQLATFSPGLSATGRPSSNVNWDISCTGFQVAVTNPVDFTSEYISSVYSIAQSSGNVSGVLANYTAGSKSATPAGGVSWNQIFSTNGTTSYIRSTSTSIAGGSASGTIVFNRTVGGSESQYTTSNASFTIAWATPTNTLTITPLSGQTFLTTYASTPYALAVSGITTAGNYAHVVTASGGTVNISSASGMFTFTPPIHKGVSVASISLSLATTFTRPAAVTGTSYTAVLNKTASPTASFTYQSFYYFTVGTGTVPVRTDIISGSAFNTGGGVTVLGNAQLGIATVEITNPSASPRAFWFGLRSTLAQPTVFKTGTSPSLMNDVTYTSGGILALEPDTPPDGYTAESYNLYAITLQSGKTYVLIS